jgi:DNA-binding FadR family transcriptional regulator
LNIFEPIKQVKASDAVYNQLKDAILTGKYKAGDKLPSERELIETFQVSRTVVREALKVLAATSFVEIKHGATGGAFVNDLTFDRLSDAWNDLFVSGKLTLPDLIEARMLIEPMVARKAAKNVNEHYMIKLRDALEKEDGSKKYPETVLNRSRVHYIIAEMSENDFLESISKTLVILVRNVTNQFKPPTDDVHPLHMHDDLVDAICKGDGDRAAKAMKSHLDEFIKRMAAAEKKYRDEKNDFPSSKNSFLSL